MNVGLFAGLLSSSNSLRIRFAPGLNQRPCASQRTPSAKMRCTRHDMPRSALDAVLSTPNEFSGTLNRVLPALPRVRRNNRLSDERLGKNAAISPRSLDGERKSSLAAGCSNIEDDRNGGSRRNICRDHAVHLNDAGDNPGRRASVHHL